MLQIENEPYSGRFGKIDKNIFSFEIDGAGYGVRNFAVGKS